MSRSRLSSRGSRSRSNNSRIRTTSSSPSRRRARTAVPTELRPSRRFYPFIYYLSDEILLKIFSNLSEGSLLSLSITSQRFHRLSDDISLWKRLYQRVFQYQMPLYHPRPREFDFLEPSSWKNVKNPWKESFRQLRHGVHVRPGFAHIYTRHRERSIRHFENLNAAIEHCNSLRGNVELLIFLHATVHRPSEITISRPLQIIGAGSSSFFEESVIIRSVSSITYAKGSRRAYLGYCTVKFIAPDWSLPFCALRITARSTPLIECCEFSATCLGKVHPCSSAIYIQDNGTNPYIRQCLLTGVQSIGICVIGGAKGIYENCIIEKNLLAGVWVTCKANPTFQLCEIFGGARVGILVSDYGLGFFEECEVHDNRGWGIEVKDRANPIINRCAIYRENAGGIFLHDQGYGLIVENCIFSNKAGIWIASLSDPVVRLNSIAFCEQGGVSVFGEGRGLIELNHIYDNKWPNLKIRTGSIPIVRHNKLNGSDYGIFVAKEGRGIIEENEIFDNKHAGVWIADESRPILRGNHIHSNEMCGVSFIHKAYGTLEGNLITHERYGVQISTDSDPEVFENKIWESRLFGIYVNESGKGAVERNLICGSGVAGVCVETDGEPVVHRNLISFGRRMGIIIGNKGRGIMEYNDIDRNTVRGVQISSDACPIFWRNQIHDGSGVGIEVANGSTVVLETNHVFKNDFDGIYLSANILVKIRNNRFRSNNQAIKKAIREGFCFFKISYHELFPVHYFYRCKTCIATGRSKICVNCIKSCHRGHDVESVHRDRFLCECGAGLLNNVCTLMKENS